MFVIIKFAASAFVIVLVSEVAKKMDRMGALISALPFVTILVMIWMHLEGASREKISNHSLYTFWYVIPSLPMFLLVPFLLEKGFSFWSTLFFGFLATFVSFLITYLIAKYFGIELLS